MYTKALCDHAPRCETVTSTQVSPDVRIHDVRAPDLRAPDVRVSCCSCIMLDDGGYEYKPYMMTPLRYPDTIREELQSGSCSNKGSPGETIWRHERNIPCLFNTWTT